MSAVSSARARHRIDRLMEHMTPSAPPALSSVPRSASSSSFSPSSPLTPPPPPTTSAAPTAATSSSPIALTDTLQLRRLQRSDYSKGFLPLLAQLTDVGDVSEERFGERFDAIERRSDGQLLFVIEDLTLHQVIASATLLVELKFIHNISKIGHIEDVVVSGEYRGKNLGYRLIDHLQRVAREVGCYKVILCCDDKNVAFYAKLGFHPHANHLACYFEKVGGGKKTTGDA